jgi:hypothetical protein
LAWRGRRVPRKAHWELAMKLLALLATVTFGSTSFAFAEACCTAAASCCGMGCC